MGLMEAYNRSRGYGGNTVPLGKSALEKQFEEKPNSDLANAWNNRNSTMASNSQSNLSNAWKSYNAKKSLLKEEKKLDGESILKEYGKTASDFQGTTLGELGTAMLGGLKFWDKDALSNASNAIKNFQGNLSTTKKTNQFIKDNNLSNEEADIVRKYITDSQNAKGNKAITDAVNKNAYTKYVGSVLSAPINVGESISNVRNNAINFATGKPMETDSAHTLATDIRNSVSKNMGKAGQFGYNVGMSIADMGTSMLIGGGAGGGALLQGLEKASSVIGDASNRGLSNNQIALEALASGVTTALTERIPMGKIESIATKGLTDTTAKSIAKSIVATALPEGLQEMAEDVADTIADLLIAKDKASIRQEIANGKSIEEATMDWLKETALDGLAGAITGGALGGANLSLGKFQNNTNQNVPTLNENLEVETKTKPTETVEIPKANEIPTLSNKEVDNILSTPELRQAWEETNGTLLKGTKAEQRKMIKDSLYESSDIANTLAKEQTDVLPDAIKRRDLINEERVRVPNTKNSGAYSADLTPIPTLTNNVPTTNSNPVVEPLNKSVQTSFDNSYTSSKNQISQTATNSYKKLFDQNEESAEWLDDNASKYTVDKKTFKDTNAVALKRVSENANDVEQSIYNDPQISAVQVAESVYLMNDKINNAIKTGDWSDVKNFSTVFANKIHDAAQSLAFLRNFGNSFEGSILKTESLIEDDTRKFLKTKKGERANKENENLSKSLVGETAKTHEEIVDNVKATLDSKKFTDADREFIVSKIEEGASVDDITKLLNRKSATDYFEIPDEELQRVNELFKEANDEDLISSKDKEEILQEAYSILAKYTGNSTFMDKWNAYRYLSMLGNLKTMKRNIEGNFGFRQVTNFKDIVAGTLESLYEKRGGQIERTKSVLTAKDNALKEASKIDFDNNIYSEAAKGGSKYDMKSEIEGNKQIFKSKALEGYRKFTSNVLEKSDLYAIKKKYAWSLASYLKANGKTSDIFKSTELADIEFLNKARKYSLKEAEIATFHEDNKIASWLNQASKNARNMGGATGTGLEILIESNVPFKKTPANILKQGVVEYSPLQFVETVRKINSKADANEVINSLSKGFTGTTILGIGALLASRGLLESQPSEEDDPFDKKSDFSFVIGDHSYTIDWLAPAAMPLFVGAEMYKSYENGESVNPFDLIATLGEPVIEMSMLSGLNNTLSSISSAVKNKNTVGTIVSNIASGYISQGIPTIAGQVARSIDPLRRSTTAETSKTKAPVLASIEKATKKAMNKIPFVSELNQPYLNVWGEEQKNTGGNFLSRLAYNTLSSGYYNNTALTEREQALVEMENNYDGEGSLIPSVASRTVDDKRLTDEQYTEYAKTRGKELKNAIDTVLNSTAVGNAKKTYMHDIELLANAIAKNKALKSTIGKTYEKEYSEYLKGGYQAVVDYYQKCDLYERNDISIKNEHANKLYDQYGESIIPTLGNIKNAYDKLNSNTAYKYLSNDDSIPVLQKAEIIYELDDSATGHSKSVQKAYDSNGYQGVYDYYTIKNEADTDNNNSISQNEITKYLRSRGYGTAEINKWIEIFGK